LVVDRRCIARVKHIRLSGMSDGGGGKRSECPQSDWVGGRRNRELLMALGRSCELTLDACPVVTRKKSGKEGEKERRKLTYHPLPGKDPECSKSKPKLAEEVFEFFWKEIGRGGRGHWEHEMKERETAEESVRGGKNHLLEDWEVREPDSAGCGGGCRQSNGKRVSGTVSPFGALKEEKKKKRGTGTMDRTRGHA